VVAKIAAGETIERPTSVVKELLENALDAGATQITLRIDGSLDRELTVVDDGVGMTKDEVLLALDRHATSKIENADDLFRLTTLGFRGEALPSIAAISATTITTCAEAGTPATEVEVVGGELLRIGETTRNRGTSVRVTDLFFNVPVRRKFMKTERGELRAATRLLSHMALSRPDVSFSLERSDRSPIRYPAASSVAERAATVFGRSTAGRFLEVAGAHADIDVRGVVGRPEQSRATRDAHVLVVNGRVVVSPLLNHAAKSGFADLIPPDRHPISVLFVDIDPSLIDVNVHPTKREIKFAHEGRVFEAVRSAVVAALDRQLTFADSRRATARHAEAALTFLAPSTPAGEPRARPDRPKLWQLHRRYIFAQTASGVLVIDQHAAHERILYERALAALNGREPTSQRLLFPETLELTANELELLTELGPHLARLGFEIEPFGERAALVRAIPDDVYVVEKAQLVRDLLDEYVHVGRSVRDLQERVARSFACRAAIKSGHMLSVAEMESLIDALFETTTPHGDPHGRATIVSFSLDELDKRFGRS
jgi:DNA mismatch repair protein MutL